MKDCSRTVFGRLIKPMRYIAYILFLAVCSGCVTSEEPAEAVVDINESMAFLDSDLRPETVLFPEYLLMEDFELERHGRVPGSTLVGAGMKTVAGLNHAHRLLSDQLAAQGWETDKVEIEKQSFRIMASLNQQTIEIRAVQGTGPTQVFILYQPGPDSGPVR